MAESGPERSALAPARSRVADRPNETHHGRRDLRACSAKARPTDAPDAAAACTRRVRGGPAARLPADFFIPCDRGLQFWFDLDSLASTTDMRCATLSWGKGRHGVLGHGSEEDAPLHSPTLCSGLSGRRVQQLCCGEAHTLALTVNSGEVYSWGSGLMGALGHGSRSNVALPRRIESCPFATQLAAGKHHSAAVCPDGSSQVLTWGWDGWEGSACVKAPTQLSHLAGTPAQQVAAGAFHLAVLTATSGVVTSGGGLVLAGVLAGAGVVRLSAGTRHTAALTADASVYVWPHVADERVARAAHVSAAALAPAPAPRRCGWLHGAVDVVCCANFTAALVADPRGGRTVRWLPSDAAHAGAGDETGDVDGAGGATLDGAESLAAGGGYLFALMADGSALCLPSGAASGGGIGGFGGLPAGLAPELARPGDSLNMARSLRDGGVAQGGERARVLCLALGDFHAAACVAVGEDAQHPLEPPRLQAATPSLPIPPPFMPPISPGQPADMGAGGTFHCTPLSRTSCTATTPHAAATPYVANTTPYATGTPFHRSAGDGLHFWSSRTPQPQQPSCQLHHSYYAASSAWEPQIRTVRTPQSDTLPHQPFPPFQPPSVPSGALLRAVPPSAPPSAPPSLPPSVPPQPQPPPPPPPPVATPASPEDVSARLAFQNSHSLAADGHAANARVAGSPVRASEEEAEWCREWQLLQRSVAPLHSTLSPVRPPLSPAPASSSSPVAASDDGSLAAQLRAMQLELARLAEAIPKDGGGGAAVSSAADGADPSAEARAALVAEVTAEVTSRVKAWVSTEMLGEMMAEVRRTVAADVAAQLKSMQQIVSEALRPAVPERSDAARSIAQHQPVLQREPQHEGSASPSSSRAAAGALPTGSSAACASSSRGAEKRVPPDGDGRASARERPSASVGASRGTRASQPGETAASCDMPSARSSRTAAPATTPARPPAPAAPDDRLADSASASGEIEPNSPALTEFLADEFLRLEALAAQAETPHDAASPLPRRRATSAEVAHSTKRSRRPWDASSDVSATPRGSVRSDTAAAAARRAANAAAAAARASSRTPASATGGSASCSGGRPSVAGAPHRLAERAAAAEETATVLDRLDRLAADRAAEPRDQPPSRTDASTSLRPSTSSPAAARSVGGRTRACPSVDSLASGAIGRASPSRAFGGAGGGAPYGLSPSPEPPDVCEDASVLRHTAATTGAARRRADEAQVSRATRSREIGPKRGPASGRKDTFTSVGNGHR